jgi:hypothetical protein
MSARCAPTTWSRAGGGTTGHRRPAVLNIQRSSDSAIRGGSPPTRPPSNRCASDRDKHPPFSAHLRKTAGGNAGARGETTPSGLDPGWSPAVRDGLSLVRGAEIVSGKGFPSVRDGLPARSEGHFRVREGHFRVRDAFFVSGTVVSATYAPRFAMRAARARRMPLANSLKARRGWAGPPGASREMPIHRYAAGPRAQSGPLGAGNQSRWRASSSHERAVAAA